MSATTPRAISILDLPSIWPHMLPDASSTSITRPAPDSAAGAGGTPQARPATNSAAARADLTIPRYSGPHIVAPLSSAIGFRPLHRRYHDFTGVTWAAARTGEDQMPV